jgi:hypothetical protein
MNAPNPHSQVRQTLADPLAIPPAPAPMLVAATTNAWRLPAVRPRRRWRTLGRICALLLCIALLAQVAGLHIAGEPETITVARTVAR